ncbi:MAG: amine oxidase [Actinomycetia bacterium]|nr:amine oxidase [Actinomycetes bacterium]
MTAPRTCVIGGGMLGMTVAHRLAQAGHRVTVVEAAPGLGGLASAWTLDAPNGPVVWDRHYHVTLLSDANNRALLRELGLEDDMRWVETRTGYFSNGTLRSASNSVEFLRLPGLRLVDKLRIGATIVYASRVRRWEPLSRVDVATWLRRWSGRRAFERFWEPQLRAKLGDGYEEVAASFIWATIQRLYAARRSGLKKEMFGYVSGGYARVIDAFSATLVSEGVDIRVGCAVDAIERVGEGVEVRMSGGTSEVFDDVVVTVAAPLAAKLCRGLTDDEYARLRAARYAGIVCVSLLSRAPLSGYYLTYLAEQMPFTGVIEMTAFVDPAQIGGWSLVYLPKYVAPDDPLFEKTDDEILETFVPALFRVYPHLTRDDIVSARVSRVRNVFAVPTVGFADRLPPMRTSQPGVYLVNSANISNGTLNVDETVALGERAARDLLGTATDAPVAHRA